MMLACPVLLVRFDFSDVDMSISRATLSHANSHGHALTQIFRFVRGAVRTIGHGGTECET
jgi:hypothetical protein